MDYVGRHMSQPHLPSEPKTARIREHTAHKAAEAKHASTEKGSAGSRKESVTCGYEDQAHEKSDNTICQSRPSQRQASGPGQKNSPNTVAQFRTWVRA